MCGEFLDCAKQIFAFEMHVYPPQMSIFGIIKKNIGHGRHLRQLVGNRTSR